jgi:thimet oligopeptidase
VSKFVTKLGLNRKLYDAMTSVDLGSADRSTRFMMEEALRNFRRAGVDKDEATRTKIEALNEELVKIGQEFDRNIRDDKRSITLDSAEELDGLPADYIENHKPGESGKITITTDYPDYFPVITYAKNESVRRKLYMEFMKRGNPKNLETLNNLVVKRNELATTLGYANWADYMTEDKMIGSTEKCPGVHRQDQHGRHPALSAGIPGNDDREEALRRERQGSGGLRQVLPGRDSQAGKVQLRQPGGARLLRFSHRPRRHPEPRLHAVGRGFRKVNDATTWHPEVEVYDVFEANALRGRIYLDLHPREGKYGHAAQFTMRNGVKDIQSPIGVLVCNFPGSKDQKPGEGLMGHDEFETFLHEFGHLMHHVFGGNQRWIDQAGVSTEWDFVEAPSQFLEEWAADPKTLQGLARHYETGKPIPNEMISQLRASRDFGEYGKGLQARHQMFYAGLSLNLTTVTRPPSATPPSS